MKEFVINCYRKKLKAAPCLRADSSISWLIFAILLCSAFGKKLAVYVAVFTYSQILLYVYKAF